VGWAFVGRTHARDERETQGGNAGWLITSRDSPTFDCPSVGCGSNNLDIRSTRVPGWEAEVDGRPAPIFMVDGLIRGVVVQGTGDHVVTVIYRPRSVMWGVSITVATLMGCLGYTGWVLRVGRR